MTVEKEGEGSESQCFVVGLQLDGNGRDLLSWVLHKAAKKDDRIVAVHVCRDSEIRKKSMLSLTKSLDDYLAVYDGLCGLKKLVLVGHVVRGNSIKKALVKEAELCSAVAVVVGVNKNCPFGGSSLAKYCSKKLPKRMTLFTVENGRVISVREATTSSSSGIQPKVIFRSMKDPRTSETLRTSYASEMKSVVDDSSNEGSPRTDDSSSSSPTAPGWPLRRKAVADSEARKMSVVQWVMRLPSRSSTEKIDIYKELENIFRKNSFSCKWFRIEELHRITTKFSSESLIGKGGNSQVYKGCLSDEQDVAIKLSKLTVEASNNFIIEADIITSLHHERVVPLIGVCLEEKNIVTVYKFFRNGSLEENLHGETKKSPLSWEIRFKIAIGLAEALNYLHNGCTKAVIHRDIKSSNILLSDEFEAQLSDFGLAIWAPTSSSYLTHSDVVGTFGHLAPEYFMYGKVSVKIDVFAFGVVLLELLSGRKPISTETPKGQESLVMWATPILEKGRFIDILDPRLDSNYDEDQMKRTMLAASLCIKRAAPLRPRMNQVLSLLKGEVELEAWMKSQATNTPKDLECEDEETYPVSAVGSHLGLALLDVDDDASVASSEQGNLSSWEEYLKGRWSRSSSFD